jgi:hypothetical protein
MRDIFVVNLKLLLSFLIVATCAGILFVRGESRSEMASESEREPGGAPVPVLVELFTSQGCSSCPPADQLLTRLAESQPVPGAEIIAISEHVDYWNRLGWKDPFSSEIFSRRQEEYAGAIRGSDPYTPQMVVNGQVQFVGSNAGQAKQAISAAANSLNRARVVVRLDDLQSSHARIHVAVSGATISSRDSADVHIAITESRLRSDVSRGENAGRQLSHTGVARTLSVAGAIDSGSFNGEHEVELDPGWRLQNLRVVVFVQERQSKRVLGATQLKLKAE